MAYEVKTMQDISLFDMEEIHADWSWNCRGGEPRAIDVNDLVMSIRQHGLMQPVIVIPYPDWKKNPGYKYLLIMGYRRYKAHQLLEYKQIRAIVQHGIESEAEALTLNLVENISRKDLDIEQETLAVKRLMALGLKRTEVAERLDQSPGWVQIRSMLVRMPPFVLREVKEGKVTQQQVHRLFRIYNATYKAKDFDTAIEVLIDAVKKIKEAKILKKVSDPLKKIEDKVAKKPPTKAEVFEMQNHIYDNIGACLATRALAWAAGEITSSEFEESLKAETEDFGKVYRKQY